jgi:hypothetical protein
LACNRGIVIPGKLLLWHRTGDKSHFGVPRQNALVNFFDAAEFERVRVALKNFTGLGWMGITIDVERRKLCFLSG